VQLGVLLTQLRHLLFQPLLQHQVKALLDALVQCKALRWLQGDFQQVVGQRFGRLPRQQHRHRFAAEADDLQRALDALRIVGLEPCRRRRIKPRQLGVHRRPANHRRLCIEFGAQRRVGLRQIR